MSWPQICLDSSVMAPDSQYTVSDLSRGQHIGPEDNPPSRGTHPKSQSEPLHVASLCISILPWSGIRGKRCAVGRSLTACYPAIRRHFYYHFLSIATLTDFDLITLSLTSVVQTVNFIQIRESGKFQFPSFNS